MMRLIGVEITRASSRRLVRFMMLGAILVLIVVGIWVYVASDPDRFAGAFSMVDLPGVFEGTSLVMGMVGWLLGASFIGAEWANRTVEAQLTWEPRRLRLLAAKIIATLVVVSSVVVVLQFLLALALLPTAAIKGSTDVPPGWLGDVLEVGARVVFIGAFTAVVGFSVATVGRNSAAAMGFGFVYLAIFESVLRAFFDIGDWLVGDNIGLFLVGSDEVPGDRTATDAGVLLCVYAGLLFAGASAIFQRRDVT
jgi:ABC-type transport system involved in multi-copper enzyme maturation permease subunit